jgi:hypothetical protein
MKGAERERRSVLARGVDARLRRVIFDRTIEAQTAIRRDPSS